MRSDRSSLPFGVLVISVATIAMALVLSPFWKAVFWSIVLAVLFWPLRQRLAAWLGGRTTAASVLVVLIVLVFGLIPALIVGSLVIDGAATVIETVKSGAFKPVELLRSFVTRLPWLSNLLDSANLDADTLEGYVRGNFSTAGEFMLSRIVGIGQGASLFFLTLFLTFYLLFALLEDGERLYRTVFDALPLRNRHKERFFAAFASMSGATIKGMVIVGLVQGALGAGIFWIMGIEGAVFWGAIMALLSVVPPFGAGFVWAPAGVLLGVDGDWGNGLILLAFGAGIISMSDNVVRPIVVGRSSSLPGFMVLITSLGGLAFFGLTGLVLGPVIAALFLTAWQLFEEDEAPSESEDQAEARSAPIAPGPTD